ncbi:hypothetical protein TUBRATIS_25160 [Tubulinosema ratisbonensis]|uniref:Uncharacterized protein n=1 Tax=Tubulinosema ratisbonensis TaxID=291195 RepID=A0A437AJ06_9MICR|nr:hypothetical protein TUBRATIS_25160 [Tubulinosema ratisbonensis]
MKKERGNYLNNIIQVFNTTFNYKSLNEEKSQKSEEKTTITESENKKTDKKLLTMNFINDCVPFYEFLNFFTWVIVFNLKIKNPLISNVYNCFSIVFPLILLVLKSISFNFVSKLKPAYYIFYTLVNLTMFSIILFVSLSESKYTLIPVNCGFKSFFLFLTIKNILIFISFLCLYFKNTKRFLVSLIFPMILIVLKCYFFSSILSLIFRLDLFLFVLLFFTYYVYLKDIDLSKVKFSLLDFIRFLCYYVNITIIILTSITVYSINIKNLVSQKIGTCQLSDGLW